MFLEIKLLKIFNIHSYNAWFKSNVLIINSIIGLRPYPTIF